MPIYRTHVLSVVLVLHTSTVLLIYVKTSYLRENQQARYNDHFVVPLGLPYSSELHEAHAYNIKALTT